MKRACSQGFCSKRRKPAHDPPQQSPTSPPHPASLHTNGLRTASLQEAAPRRSSGTQLPEEVIQNILKFGGVPRCGVLKGKAYLLLHRGHARNRRYSKSLLADLYERRHEDIFGSVSAIANERGVVCKEKCSDWNSYTERCISKSMKSHFDVTTSFYLVMRTLYDSFKKLFPPVYQSTPFDMTLRVLKEKAHFHASPLIRCYNSEISYIIGQKGLFTFTAVPGSDRFEIKQYNNEHPGMYLSKDLLRDSIASLKNYTFQLEFDVETADDYNEEAEEFYRDQVGFVEFSFGALSGDKLLSSFKQVARGYS